MSQKWDSIQQLSFPDWINYHLRPKNLHVDDVSQLSDGVLLIHLLESISGKKFKRYVSKPKFLQQKIDNVQISLQFLQNEMDLKVIGCNPQDIVSGNTKQIMGIIFLLIQYKKHQDFDADAQGYSESEDIPGETEDELSQVELPPRHVTPIEELEVPLDGEESSKGGEKDDPILCSEEEPVTDTFNYPTLSSDNYHDEHKIKPIDVKEAKNEQIPVPSPVDSASALEEDSKNQEKSDNDNDNNTESVEEGESLVEKQKLSTKISQPEETTMEQNKEKNDKENVPHERECTSHEEKENEDNTLITTPTGNNTLITTPTENEKIVQQGEGGGGEEEEEEIEELKKKRRKGRKKKKEIRPKPQHDVQEEVISEEIVQKQRSVIANEILQTERFYVNGLTILINFFLCPLREKGIITAALLRRIFSDIEVLFGFNCQFLDNLESRMKNWEENEFRLGDLFLREVDYLKMYTMYVNNYNESVKAVAECKKKNNKFQEFVEKARYSDTCNGLDVTSYLIMPVQRIPRYVLLLADLLKHTPTSHVDYKDLKAAVERTKEVADYVNEKKREAENLNQVVQVQERLGGKIELLEDASRRFVREGVLTDLSGSEKRNRYVFLFNDMLVCAGIGTKEFRDLWKKCEGNSALPTSLSNALPASLSLKYKCSIPLLTSHLKEPSSNLQKLDQKWKNMFQLQWTSSVTGDSKIQSFIAPTYEIKQAWMGEIDECIMQLLDIRKTRCHSVFIPHANSTYHETEPFHNIADTVSLQDVGTGKWKDRYIVLKNGVLHCYKNEYSMELEKFSLEIISCTVRLHRPSVKEFAFQLLAPDQIFYFCVRSGEQLFEWIYAIRDAVERMMLWKGKEEKKVKYSVPPVLLQALTDRENQLCADCNSPVQWANLTLGVFLCGECYTLHKILSPSKLKSLIHGGRWKEEEAISMAAKGNQASPYQSKLPDTVPTSYGARVSFIKEKYSFVESTPSSPVQESKGRSSSSSSSKLTGRKTGWLILLNDSENKNYFYCLKKGSLCYYKSEKMSGSPKGVIDLHAATVLCPEDDQNKIEITTPDRIYHLFCPSAAEREEWRLQINTAKLRPRHRGSFRLRVQKNLTGN